MAAIEFGRAREHFDAYIGLFAARAQAILDDIEAYLRGDFKLPDIDARDEYIRRRWRDFEQEFREIPAAIELLRSSLPSSA